MGEGGQRREQGRWGAGRGEGKARRAQNTTQVGGQRLLKLLCLFWGSLCLHPKLTAPRMLSATHTQEDRVTSLRGGGWAHLLRWQIRSWTEAGGSVPGQGRSGWLWEHLASGGNLAETFSVTVFQTLSFLLRGEVLSRLPFSIMFYMNYGVSDTLV